MPLTIAASITIVYGSVRALSQDKLKPRLAYSTISQVSYIILGTAIVGPVATIGGIVHLPVCKEPARIARLMSERGYRCSTRHNTRFVRNWRQPP